MQCGGGCPTLNLLDQIFSYMRGGWMMFWGTFTHQQSAALQNCTHSMLCCLAHLIQTTITDNVKKSTDWSICQTNRNTLPIPQCSRTCTHSLSLSHTHTDRQKLGACMSIDVRKNFYAVSPLVWSVL